MDERSDETKKVYISSHLITSALFHTTDQPMPTHQRSKAPKSYLQPKNVGSSRRHVHSGRLGEKEVFGQGEGVRTVRHHTQLGFTLTVVCFIYAYLSHTQTHARTPPHTHTHTHTHKHKHTLTHHTHTRNYTPRTHTPHTNIRTHAQTRTHTQARRGMHTCI